MKMSGRNSGSKLFSLVTLLLLSSVVTAQPCPSFCRLRLCFRLGNIIFASRENPIQLLRPAGRPQGAFPCQMKRSGRLVGLRNVIGREASVSPAKSGRPFVPSSEFEDASPRFPSSFFSFGFFDLTQHDSIVSRQARGNQREVLENLCVRLPVRSHDLLRRDGSLRRRVMLNRPRDCIGFRTRIAELDIELLWDTPNDFNIRLIEPSGFQINRDNPVSPSGGRLSAADSGANGCIASFHADRIRYRRTGTVPTGGYIILIDNVNECAPVTEYTLRVTFRGRTMIDETDVVTATGVPIASRTFEIR